MFKNKILILKSISLLLYSFLLSISLFYTNKINLLKHTNSLKNPNIYILDINDIPHIFQYFIPVFLIITLTIILLKHIRINLNTKLNFSKNNLTILLFLAWFPFLLVFYPAVGMNDTYFILHSITGSSVQHPFYYGLFIYLPAKISLKLFDTMTYGLFVSTICQMLFMSYSIVYAISWLNQKLKNKYVISILILYFAFTPIIANYSIAAVKDTIFSITLMLWIPFLYDTFVENKNIFKNKNIKYYFYFLAFMTMAMRNNGSYIFIILLLLLLYKCITERKQLLKSSIILFIICSLPNFYLSVFRDKPQLFQEAVAIPIQQISRTIAVDGTLNEFQKNFLDKLIPLKEIKKSYNPFSVDSIKWNSKFNRKYLQNNKGYFFKVWITGFFNNKHIYLDAWMLQTFGCWANKTQDWVDQSKFGWSLTDDVLKKGVSPSENNKLKVSSIRLPDTFKNALGNYLFKNSDFINPGNCFWILGYIALLIIFKNNISSLIVLLPIFLCWITLILAVPATFVYRYAFMYPLCLPFLIFIPFIYTKEHGDNNSNV